jgi:hypothetical protein
LDVHLNSGISARVNDFAADDFLNGKSWHGNGIGM